MQVLTIGGPQWRRLAHDLLQNSTRVSLGMASKDLPHPRQTRVSVGVRQVLEVHLREQNLRSASVSLTSKVLPQFRQVLVMRGRLWLGMVHSKTNPATSGPRWCLDSAGSDGTMRDGATNVVSWSNLAWEGLLSFRRSTARQTPADWVRRGGN